MEYRVEYPFCLAKGEHGLPPYFKWSCGVRLEQSGSEGEYLRAECDGEGEMILTEVSRHKPGRFPERVFYTRKFIDPDGLEFGNGKLRICSDLKFKRLCGPFWTHADDHSYEVAAK